MNQKAMSMLGLFIVAVAGPALAIDVDEDSSLVCSASVLNFLEPDATLVIENPSGTAEVHMEKYAILGGRDGGQTISGGLNSGEGLVLSPNVAGDGSGTVGVFDPTQAQWSLNGFGQPRLIIGGNTDFSTYFAAGGLLQFIVENDTGNNAIAALFTAADSTDAPAQIAGIRARGSCTTPLSINQGDNIFDLLAMAYDADNNPSLAGVLDWTSSGAPGHGYSPSGLAMNVMGPDASLHALVVTTYGPLRLEHAADATAENDTWYFSTDASKPVYKDSGGAVHPLYGLPAQTDSKTLTVQSTDVSPTNLADSGAGLYRLSYYLVDTAADATAGAVTLGVTFTDDSGSQTVTAGPVALTALGTKAHGETTVQLASGHVAFSTTHTGSFGTATYSLYLALERIA